MEWKRILSKSYMESEIKDLNDILARYEEKELEND